MKTKEQIEAKRIRKEKARKVLKAGETKDILPKYSKVETRVVKDAPVKPTHINKKDKK